jgi:hypothetical protein
MLPATTNQIQSEAEKQVNGFIEGLKRDAVAELKQDSHRQLMQKVFHSTRAKESQQSSYAV